MLLNFILPQVLRYPCRGSTTTSISSSAWRFEEENGRTYHSYRPGGRHSSLLCHTSVLTSVVYFYPNDATEAVRLDYQSSLLKFAFDGKLHQAPLDNPLAILDVGTGTGAWAIQMADLYPNSKIEATDLSPIQPSVVPENVTFIIDDAEEDDWTLHESYYDYIHTCVLMGCFEDFKSIIAKGFRYTKPGGWMESVEPMHQTFCDDGTMPADWPFTDWHDIMENAANNANRPLKIAHRLKKWYTEVGFVDVHERVVKVPINSWARDPKLKALGHYWAENWLAGLNGFSLALFSRVLGWSKKEIDVEFTVRMVRRECN
jgi:metalloendopeptidase OMA1, mitochondrial